MTPALIEREGLQQRPRVRNFALLLFARDLQRWFPHAHTVVSFYAGADRAGAESERHELTGTVDRQVRAALTLLARESHGITDKRDPRPNRVRYPELAVQEAVVNAIAHRDYEAAHPVRITVFADRMEIWSPGGLDPRVDRARFARGDSGAVWRNQAIAAVFRQLNLAQTEGQGIRTMRREFESQGAPAPLVEPGEGWVLCTLRAHPWTVEGVADLRRELLGRRRPQLLERVRAFALERPGNLEALRLAADADPLLGRHGALLFEVLAAAWVGSAVSSCGERGEVLAILNEAIAHLQVGGLLLALGKGSKLGDLIEVRRRWLADLDGARLAPDELPGVVAAVLAADDRLLALELLDGNLPEDADPPAAVRVLRAEALIGAMKRVHDLLAGSSLTARLRSFAEQDRDRITERFAADLAALPEPEFEAEVTRLCVAFAEA